MHLNGNILIIFQMRFQKCFWYYSQCSNQSNQMDGKIWIDFTGCLCGVLISLWVNNIHQLAFSFLSVTSISVWNALRSIALPVFAEYDNKAQLIFLFTCKDIDWLSFLITTDFYLSLKVAFEFLFTGSWNDTLCCIKS